jgi:Flp pilus assembly protein TadG
MPRAESGSSAVEVTFALAVLMLLTLGAIEVALVLYGRNVVMASAHEGARAAIELGTTSTDATHVATETVRRAAGGLVDGLSVGVVLADTGGRSQARVRVSGALRAIGPVPLRVPVSVVARASRAHVAP